MPSHLFKYTDLEPLENHPPYGDFNILIVGTFNGKIDGNQATWFYGRPDNEFWCLFPRMLDKESLHPVDNNQDMHKLTQEWRRFCSNHKIIIVDLFKDIHIELPNHSDKNLEKLKPNEYIAFDFQRAFANCKFKHVIFTWKGMANNTLTQLKTQYINYFAPRGSQIVHLLTPSMAYAKSRHFKLKQWKGTYQND